MKLKEIEPGMIIHCKNDEEKKALHEELCRIGNMINSNNGLDSFENFKSGIDGVNYEIKDLKVFVWGFTRLPATHEFTDLIIPELTTEEVLQIRNKLSFDFVREYLGFCYGKSLDEMLREATPEQIIDMCNVWKSDHEKKEPEIEWVYKVYDGKTGKFFDTEKDAIEYCESVVRNNPEICTFIDKLCRVKGGTE